ncbi:MAG: hypothetical protein HYW50_01505, partial [Candidatus Diapherotrites archaeon]|nr:hypothetical protein [Candidatus Diapherotrites archaeon]
MGFTSFPGQLKKSLKKLTKKCGATELYFFDTYAFFELTKG